MSRALRGGLVLLLAFVAVAVGVAPAYACVCRVTTTLKDAIAAAEVVFAGEMVRPLDDERYEVRVDTVYRGSLPPTVTVHTTRTDCGSELENGEPILYVGSDRLGVGQCGSSRYGDSALAYEANHVGRPPDPRALDPGAPRSKPPSRAIPVVLALALCAVAGTVAVRTRRNGAASAAGTASAG